jgi:hypothetical protein
VDPSSRSDGTCAQCELPAEPAPEEEFDQAAKCDEKQKSVFYHGCAGRGRVWH